MWLAVLGFVVVLHAALVPVRVSQARRRAWNRRGTLPADPSAVAAAMRERAVGDLGMARASRRARRWAAAGTLLVIAGALAGVVFEGTFPRVEARVVSVAEDPEDPDRTLVGYAYLDAAGRGLSALPGGDELDLGREEGARYTVGDVITVVRVPWWARIDGDVPTDEDGHPAGPGWWYVAFCLVGIPFAAFAIVERLADGDPDVDAVRTVFLPDPPVLRTARVESRRLVVDGVPTSIEMAGRQGPERGWFDVSMTSVWVAGGVDDQGEVWLTAFDGINRYSSQYGDLTEWASTWDDEPSDDQWEATRLQRLEARSARAAQAGLGGVEAVPETRMRLVPVDIVALALGLTGAAAFTAGMALQSWWALGGGGALLAASIAAVCVPAWDDWDRRVVGDGGATGRP